MNKYNRGTTIIEILVSVAIIGIVLLLLFTLLVQVRNEDKNNNIQSNFIINQSTFIKVIEDDITNYGVAGVSSCTFADVNIDSATVAAGDENNYKCIRIEYKANYLKDKVGYLIIYNYYSKYDIVNGQNKGKDPKWMIKYVRGYYEVCQNGDPTESTWKEEVTVMKEIPSEINMDLDPYVVYTAQQAAGDGIINAASIVVPIENIEGERYDINLGLTYNRTTGMNKNDIFYCKANTNKKQVNKLICDCRSSKTLCDATQSSRYYTCKN